MSIQDDLRRQAKMSIRALGPNIAALMIEAANTIDRLEKNLSVSRATEYIANELSEEQS